MPNGTSLDTLLISQYTSGTNMPNAAQANYIAVANAQGNNLDYKPAAQAIVADDTLATALAPNLRGVGLTVDGSSNLQVRPRPRKYCMQDYFLSGNLNSGSIGAYGWNLLGVGSPTVTAVSGSGLITPKINLNTSGSINDTAILCLGSTTANGRVGVNDIQILQAQGTMNNVLTAKRLFFGFLDDMASEPSVAVNCFGIMYDSALGTDYKIISRFSSVGSPVSTGATVPANTQELMTLYQNGANWLFYIGNTLIGSVPVASVSNAPTVNIGWRVQTLAAASKTYRPVYFGLESMVLPTPANTDAFLEV